ncbi:hypothetical protein A8C32_02555 [Flavivirga aquatica]|uniref:Thioredoxin domain-containing protein n=1 Tax=Flavivirga aquatica TaxID=1849968 RepID=A0A1E5TBC7_9FLAO|nr:hypothetical protein A8C32_02555 [Flavivirga aquatica]
MLILISFFSCKKDSSKNAINYAYIGGEIINPGTNFVVLSKGETILDTIKLDGRNRFLYKIDNLQEGIYKFRHAGEYQMILLEQKDSILFRLNTLDFDGSLVFTGQGDKKNNYLINDFLANEKEEKYIVKLCQLNPIEYQKHIDSLKNVKTKIFETFKEKYETSTLFKKIAQLNIDYSYYSNKEVYPFFRYDKNKADILKSLPDDFYDYRKDINYNDAFLSNYYNYNTFLRHNFSNLSLKRHNVHSNQEAFNRNSLCYNLDRLKLIDSLVTNVTIKNHLLYHFTINYLSNGKSQKKNNAILKSFLNKSNDEDDKKQVTSYTKSLNNLRKGLKLPNVKLVNYNDTEFAINSLINKPTVVSFWSHDYYDHFKDSHNKINELKEKYPEIEFIIINTDGCGLDKSKKMMNSHRFDITNEYQFKSSEKGIAVFAIHPITKAIIIDGNKKIMNSNANIFSVHFENQLLGVINK